MQTSTRATLSHLDDVEERVRKLREDLAKSVRKADREERRKNGNMKEEEEDDDDDDEEKELTPRTKIMEEAMVSKSSVTTCSICGEDIVTEYLDSHQKACRLVHKLAGESAKKAAVAFVECDLCGARVRADRMEVHKEGGNCARRQLRLRSQQPGGDARGGGLIGSVTMGDDVLPTSRTALSDSEDEVDAEVPQAPQVRKGSSRYCYCKET